MTTEQVRWQVTEFINGPLCNRAGSGRPIEVPEGLTTGELQYLIGVYKEYDVTYDAAKRILKISRRPEPDPN